MAHGPEYAFDDDGLIAVAPANIITSGDLFPLLAYLRSSLAYFCLRKFYMGGGIEGELKTNRLLLLPIPCELKTPEVSSKMMAISETEKDLGVSDDFFFHLVGLTSEEIVYIDECKRDNDWSI